jgi:CheY-like chemotaxis protein
MQFGIRREKMGKRILVVDDEENSRKFLDRVLTKKGYQVSLAQDGVEGLGKAKEEKPDLIVLDVMMPRKNGIKVLEAVRKDEELSDTPVIMLSAVASFIEQAYKDPENAETIKKMETLLDNSENMSEVCLLSFSAVRKCLLVNRKALIEKFRNRDLTTESASCKMLPDAFLDKPVDPGELTGMVAKLIGTS